MVQDYLKLRSRPLKLHTRIRDFPLEVLLQLFITAGAVLTPLLHDDELILGEGDCGGLISLVCMMVVTLKCVTCSGACSRLKS